MKKTDFAWYSNKVWAAGFCILTAIIVVILCFFHYMQDQYTRHCVYLIGLCAESVDTQSLTELVSQAFAAQNQDDLYRAGAEVLNNIGYGTSYFRLVHVNQIAVLLGVLVLLVSYIGFWFFFSHTRKHCVHEFSSWIRDESATESIGCIPQELSDAVLELKQNIVRQAQVHAEKTAKMFRYFEDLSHQMKTPLAVIRAACERTELKFPACSQSMELVTSQIDRLVALIAQILQLGRFDCGRLSLHFEYIQARDLLEAVTNNLFAVAEKKHIQFSVEGDPQIRWYCDIAWMQEAVANVLKNCIEHSDSGTISLRYETANHLNRLVIQDHGEGFQQGYEKEAFQRYSMLGRRGKEGAGLGLAIAGQILQLHFGRAQAQNVPEGGAQFTFTFPMLDADQIYQTKT